MSFDVVCIKHKGIEIKVSIPLEQGNVFRRLLKHELVEVVPSQSLWNRAMSFD